MTLARRLAAPLLASFALAAGCDPAPPTASPTAAPSATAPPAAPPAAAGALGPLQRYALPAADRVSFGATVVERLDAGSYGYLRVVRDDTGASAWVATLRPSAAPGARVRITAFGRARDFDSKRLGRRFDDLYFAAVRRA